MQETVQQATHLPPSTCQQYIQPLLRLCRDAGELICGHYHAPGAGEHESKHDDSPLTQADLESHALLDARLRELAGAYPVLSEESSAEQLAGRRSWERYWLVDPLDGTREFLGRTGEFTINIALINQHKPVLGVLYLPLERVAYVGIPGSISHRYDLREGDEWTSVDLATRRLVPGHPLTMLASRRHRSRRLLDCIDWLQQAWGPIERLDSGSALKFCQLAAGEGDFYPRFSPCCEWDTAAGQAVLEAAGGALLGLDGQPLRYNCRDSLMSPNFYGIADPANPLWQALFGEDRQ